MGARSFNSSNPSSPQKIKTLPMQYGPSSLSTPSGRATPSGLVNFSQSNGPTSPTGYATPSGLLTVSQLNGLPSPAAKLNYQRFQQAPALAQLPAKTLVRAPSFDQQRQIVSQTLSPSKLKLLGGSVGSRNHSRAGSVAVSAAGSASGRQYHYPSMQQYGQAPVLGSANVMKSRSFSG